MGNQLPKKNVLFHLMEDSVLLSSLLGFGRAPAHLYIIKQKTNIYMILYTYYYIIHTYGATIQSIRHQEFNL